MTKAWYESGHVAARNVSVDRYIDGARDGTKDGTRDAAWDRDEV